MRKLINATLLSMLAAVLAACSVVNGPERWKSLPTDQSATIFGTVTMGDTGAAYNRVAMYYRNIETKEEAYFQTNIEATGDPELTKDKWQPGFVFEMKIPAGNYEYYNFFAVRQGLGGATQWRAKKDYSIPFVIEAGRTYYIGEYRAESYIGKGIFVSQAAAGPYFLVVDNEKRDTQLWLKKRKEPFDGAITKQIPQVGPDNPFVRTTMPAFGDLGPYGGCSGWFC